MHRFEPAIADFEKAKEMDPENREIRQQLANAQLELKKSKRCAVCLPVCLSACLHVCLSACLSICLFARLPVCLSTCLPVCLSCLSACLANAQLEFKKSKRCRFFSLSCPALSCFALPCPALPCLAPPHPYSTTDVFTAVAIAIANTAAP
jgi:hypothetical protein